MLSCDLENLAANVRRLYRGRTPITPIILESIAHELDGHADAARALEAHTVPRAARFDPALGLDPSVVPLRRFAGGDLS